MPVADGWRRALGLVGGVLLGIVPVEAQQAPGLSLVFRDPESVVAVEPLAQPVGDTPVRFRMVEIAKESSPLDLPGGRSFEARIIASTMEADCRKTMVRARHVEGFDEQSKSVGAADVDTNGCACPILMR